MSWWENIVGWISALDPVATVFGITGISGGSVYAYMKRRFKRQEVIRENLEQNLELQKAEIKDLKREIDILRQYDPHAWLEQAQRERKDGNEEKAITALRSGVVLTSDALHKAYLTLARHHVAIYPDQGEALHLQEAERLSQIAALLKPDDKLTTSLVEEIRETMVMGNIHRGYYNPYDLYETTAITGLYGSELGEEFIAQLLNIALTHHEAGRYIFFERLTHRARFIGLRELGENSETTRYARYCWATALRYSGHYSAAKAEIEELLPLVESAQGMHHSETLSIRRLHAQILISLGRYQEALEEVEELLPISQSVHGKQHKDTLSIRHLHAQILNFLGRYQEALEEVEELLPISQSVHGKQHKDTLSIRHLHVQILNSLERYQEALEEVEELLPISERVRGGQHPDTLSICHVHAQTLVLLARYQEALEEVEELLPISQSVRGAQHPDSLIIRYLHAHILNSLERHQEALEEIEELLLIGESVQGAQHPDILVTRQLHAHILNSLERYQEALEEVEELLPISESVRGVQHPETLKVISLKQEILEKLKGQV